MNPVTRRIASPLIALAAALTLHCQPERQETMTNDLPQPPITESAAPAAVALDAPLIGTKLGPDGSVAEKKDSFEQGEPIWLTLQLPQTPPGVQVEIMVRDTNGEEIKSVFPTAGGATATVPLRELEPGRYTAEGLWSDEKHWEVRFEIR